MMRAKRILIAGVGNIFLGDDAFGVEVARRLGEQQLPDGVRVVDFGIRGFDLAYALLEDDDAAILVDALPRGVAPGTLCVLEPTLDDVDPAAEPDLVLETHGMDPLKVLRLVRALGGSPRRMLVIGCEPASLGEDEDGPMGLSEPVQAAVDEAVALVGSVVARLLEEAEGALPIDGSAGLIGRGTAQM